MENIEWNLVKRWKRGELRNLWRAEDYIIVWSDRSLGRNNIGIEEIESDDER